MEIKLNIIKELEDLSIDRWGFIQVILGPRQVGKTTAIRQFLESAKATPHHYVSADGQIGLDASWIEEQWTLMKSKSPRGLLVIDEIQKIEGWSDKIKQLWDIQARSKEKIRLILLGSSSLDIEIGLNESLTGRFQLRFLSHWSFQESQLLTGMDLEEYLRFGGYPGSYTLRDNPQEWISYLQHSIVNTVIGKDLLQLRRVKSPALFKQCFDLVCEYGGREISYNKLLGQLQEKGNVEIVKHYLDLFEGAFLVKQIPKFHQKKVLTRTSSPKLLPLCPALYSLGRSAHYSKEERGWAFEIAVGAALSRLPGKLFYWREGQYEVDYIYQNGSSLKAIEVKSGRNKLSRGLSVFAKRFPKAEPIVITPEIFTSIETLVTRQ
jgi:uncharacterized protein